MAAEELNNDFEYKKILLANSNLLAEVDEDTVDEITKCVKEVSVKKGEPLFVENEPGDSVFFLSSGSVEVIKTSKIINRPQRVAVYNSGEHFSELSSLVGSAHTTSCFALQDSTLLELSSEDFLRLLTSSQAIANTLLKNMSHRSFKFIKDHGCIHQLSDMLKKNYPLSEKIHKDIMAEKAFVALPSSDRTVIVGMEDPFDQTVIDIVKQAHPNSTVNIFSIRSAVINEILAKDGFIVDDEEVDSQEHPIDEKLDLTDFKNRCTILENLNDKQMNMIKKHSSEIVLDAGETLFVPNTKVEMLYIIESGRVDVSRTIESDVLSTIYFAEPGDTLGEVTLLTDRAHIHVARATEDSRVIAVPADVVNGLLKFPQFSISLAQSIARRLQYLSENQSIRYKNIDISQHLVVTSSLMPLSAIEKYQVLPFQKEGQNLWVGVVNPLNNKDINEIVGRYLPDFNSDVFAIPRARFLEILEELKNKKTEETSNSAGQRRYNRHLLDEILSQSLARKAASVHIEPLQDRYMIRFRIDGEMWEYDQIYPEIGSRLINRIKVSAKLDVQNNQQIQHGRIDKTVGSEPRLGEVKILPTVHGEKVVINWATATTSLIPLNMLIPDTNTIKFLKEILRSKQGVFFITGPERSGRKGTVYSCLEEINSLKLNISTIEDPVSLEVSGINQVSLKGDKGPSQKEALKMAALQESDVIFIEDVDSEDVAKEVFNLAQKGSLVIATTFSAHSLDLIDNLRNWGVNDSLVASQLLGVMAQRLIPRLCDSCRRTRAMTASQKRVVSGVIEGLKSSVLWEARTCHDCSQTGYKGRVPLLEYWKKTPLLREALMKNTPSAEIHEILLKEGFSNMRINGYQISLNGLSTIDQVEKHLKGIVW